ncbi:MAG: hypothetical protein M0Z81_04790 [Deltaproteobacteria bacterium]|jgi:hypothetical protein|nr:hypothetical protein [Deltaproteobacteria bacterium]
MNAEVFADWLAIQGHRVIKTANSYWFDQGPRAFQAFPYHHLIHPGERELKDLLLKEKAVCIRFSAPIDSGLGALSYHMTYESPDYDLRMLDRRSRQNIRKGLSNCCIEPISLERLSAEGFALEVDTLQRQARNLNISRNGWRKKFLSAVKLPGFEAWGALVNGHLGASLFTFQMDDWCYMLHAQCDRQYLPLRINNALSYVVTKTMMERNTVNSVFYSLHSLDASSSVDQFKLRMGYTAKPVLQCVSFHPCLSIFLNSFTHYILSRLVRKYPGRDLLSKSEGLLRFYLKGKGASKN